MDIPEKSNPAGPGDLKSPPVPPMPPQPEHTSSEPSMPPVMPAAPGTPPVKKRRFPIIAFSVFVVFILVFVGGLFYLRQSLSKEINKHGRMDHESMEMDMTTSSSHGGMAMDHTLVHDSVLTIGSDPTFQPMEYRDEKGEIVGYDADLGQEIAREMGVTADIKTIAWDDVFTALENKEIDIIISAVSITDERKQKYAFSDPYLNAGQVILTRKTTTNITQPADLAGKKVGVQVNTTSLKEAQKYDADTTAYPNPDAAVVDLVNSKLDAVIADLPAAKGYADENPTLQIASDPFTSEYYGIVFRKGDIELQNHVNQILADLQQKGILADLREKWLE